MEDDLWKFACCTLSHQVYGAEKLTMQWLGQAWKAVRYLLAKISEDNSAKSNKIMSLGGMQYH